MSRRVLVIGGTRFIGPFLVRRLLDDGCDVTLLHRGQTGADIFPDLRHIITDRRELESLRTTFAELKPDVVLDMIPLGEDDARGVMSTFRGIARRVVALSSGDVYRAYGRLICFEPGPIDSTPLTEDAPLREKHFPYRGQSERLENYEKILAERIFRGASELPGTILRLPVVYGPGDYQHRLWQYLKRMLDGRPAILLDSAHAEWRISRAFVGNVAEAIALAVVNDHAAGRIYNVAEITACTEREWIERIASSVGWDGEIIALPGGEYPDLVESDFNPAQDLSMDSERIRAELTYAETTDTDNAMKATIAWESVHQPADGTDGSIDYAVEDRILTQLQSQPTSLNS